MCLYVTTVCDECGFAGLCIVSPEDDFAYDFHFNPIEQGMYDE